MHLIEAKLKGLAKTTNCNDLFQITAYKLPIISLDPLSQSSKSPATPLVGLATYAAGLSPGAKELIGLKVASLKA